MHLPNGLCSRTCPTGCGAAAGLDSAGDGDKTLGVDNASRAAESRCPIHSLLFISSEISLWKLPPGRATLMIKRLVALLKSDPKMPVYIFGLIP